MQQIQTFDFEDHPVRTGLHGELPIFAAPDICRVLDIANSRDALSTLDEDEKITVGNSDGNPRAGIPHQMAWLTESGLYALIFKSRKPQARAFRKWVTNEVLPAIRQHGTFSLAPETINFPRIQHILAETIVAVHEDRCRLSKATTISVLTTQYLRSQAYHPSPSSRPQPSAIPGTGERPDTRLFWTQCFEPSPNPHARVCVDEVYSEYVAWCAVEGLRPIYPGGDYLSRALLTELPHLRDHKERVKDPENAGRRRMCYRGFRIRNWRADLAPESTETIELTA